MFITIILIYLLLAFLSRLKKLNMPEQKLSEVKLDKGKSEDLSRDRRKESEDKEQNFKLTKSKNLESSLKADNNIEVNDKLGHLNKKQKEVLKALVYTEIMSGPKAKRK